MGRKRINPKRALTNLEKQRKIDDEAASIDAALEEAWTKVDWTRRNQAEQSLVQFVNTYLIGLTLDEPPSMKGEEVLHEMEQAITSHSNYAIALHRGAGKSAFCVSTTIYALVTGRQKFIVIIANNARASGGLLNDIWKVFQEPDTPLVNDYPEIFLPFIVAHGSFRRRQLFKGRSLDIKKNANELILPTYTDKRFKRASGSLVITRSVTGGLRGIRHGTMRPSMVMLDDLQTTESAQHPEQVEKLLDVIKSDVIPLAGKQRISLLQTFTPIRVDDLVQKIREDSNWRTTVYPAIMSMPKNMALWDEYFRMWDSENVAGVSHAESLAFYDQNKDEMDDGVQVFNPTRYSEKDGHHSMIQKLLELKHTLGESVFNAEYQMKPAELQFALPITPKLVASRLSTLKECQLPEKGVQCVIASSDLNLSKYITTTIVCFNNDGTANVIWKKFRKCSIPANLPEADYQKRVYDLLGQHGRELKKLADDFHFKIDAYAIDANGVPWEAVLSFCKNSMQICGISACGFVGRASHLFRPFVRSRLKEATQETVLCGDADEHEKRGTGRKWVYFNSDLYHETVQKAFLAEVGNIGSLTWYSGGGNPDWAIQVCNEKLMMKRNRQDGTIEYTWKDIGDHDALDSIGQAFAAHASLGYSSGVSGRPTMRVKMVKKPKFRFV